MDDEMKDRISKISQLFTKFIEEIEPLLYPGRCAAIAQTKLEEAHMWLMNMVHDTTIKEVAKIKEATVNRSKIIMPVPTVAPELVKSIVEDLKNK